MSEIELPPEAISAINRGDKIEAIKLVRERSGCGLKEAKDAIDAHIARNPALKAQLARESSEALRRGLVRLLIVAAVVIAVWQWLLAR